MTITQQQQEAIKFNSNLGVPVNWKPAKKVSWRSSHGWVDYDSRSTHYHILLLEDFVAGRIKRKFGDFLCGTKITDKTTHKIVNLQMDMDPSLTMKHKVTCPKCLERVAKLKK